MLETITLTRDEAQWLAPGHVYTNIDDAMHAASCLCGLSPNGATVCGRTEGLDECYIVTCDVVRSDGSMWAPQTAYEPIYTITRAR